MLAERLSREDADEGGVPELPATEGDARAEIDDGESRGRAKERDVYGDSSAAPTDPCVFPIPPAVEDETLSLRLLEPCPPPGPVTPRVDPEADRGVAGELDEPGEPSEEGLNADPPSDNRFRCRLPPALIGVDGAGAEGDDQADMAAGEAAMLN